MQFNFEFLNFLEQPSCASRKGADDVGAAFSESEQPCDDGKVPKHCETTKLVRMCSAMGMGVRVSIRIPYFSILYVGIISPFSTSSHK